jgi:hypothetical protein
LGSKICQQNKNKKKKECPGPEKIGAVGMCGIAQGNQ